MRHGKSEDPLVRVSDTASVYTEGDETLYLGDWICSVGTRRDGKFVIQAHHWATKARKTVCRVANGEHGRRVLSELIAHQRTGDGVVDVSRLVDERLLG